jgi:hypothetical protein
MQFSSRSVTSSLLDQNILLSTLFSNTSVYSLSKLWKPRFPIHTKAGKTMEFVHFNLWKFKLLMEILSWVAAMIPLFLISAWMQFCFVSVFALQNHSFTNIHYFMLSLNVLLMLSTLVVVVHSIPFLTMARMIKTIMFRNTDLTIAIIQTVSGNIRYQWIYISIFVQLCQHYSKKQHIQKGSVRYSKGVIVHCMDYIWKKCYCEV